MRPIFNQSHPSRDGHASVTQRPSPGVLYGQRRAAYALPRCRTRLDQHQTGSLTDRSAAYSTRIVVRPHISLSLSLSLSLGHGNLGARIPFYLSRFLLPTFSFREFFSQKRWTRMRSHFDQIGSSAVVFMDTWLTFSQFGSLANLNQVLFHRLDYNVHRLETW